MKKLIWLSIAAIAYVYGIAAVRLNESSVNAYISELETLSLRGEMKEYCDRLHDELEVSISDRTNPDSPAEIQGGKREYCNFVSHASQGFSLLGLQTNLIRDDFEVKRGWLSPWTAHVSYHERRTSTMTRVNATLHTESDDRWILVNTFGGVKVRRLESQSWRVQ